GGIAVVEPDVIAVGIADLIRTGAAELAVRAGVAEIPGKLLSHDFDGEGIGRRVGQVFARPDAAPLQAETDENDGGHNGPGDFEAAVFVPVERGAGTPSAEAPEEGA